MNSRNAHTGRKRPRNERSTKRFCCANTFVLPLTVAGIAAACFLNVSDIGPASFAFAFVFHHPAHFPALRERFNSIQNDDHRILRHTKTNSQRHDRTSILDFATDNILDELDDESRKNEDGCKTSHCGSSSSRSSSLVVATSTSLDSALDSTSSTPAAPSSSSRHLPPWLASVEDEFAGLSAPAEASKRIRHEIEYLETALVSFRGGDFFSKADVRDVIRAIHWCAASSNHSEDRDMSQKVSKIVGSVSFCRLLLQLEDDTFDIRKYQQNKNSNRNNNDNSNNTMDNKSYLITKDVLLASILHYSECVDLRYDGVYDEMQNSLHENSDLAMLSTITDDINNEDTTHDLTIVLSRDVNNIKHRTKTRQDSSMMMHSSRESKKTDSNNDLFEDIFSIESLELANAAARLKRVEILTSVTLTSRKDAEEKRRPLKKEEYTAARNLMVSLTDDWRALAIRCVASLFRLEGILKHSKINAGTGQFSRHHTSRSRSHRGAEITLAAKDSLQMYANLSEQMGLHRLHSQLEAKAFRILYPRQYSASSVLFQEHGTAMNAISGFLSNQLKQLLCEDLSLMYELENLEVISRVKEPYSFWKKLLKKRNASIAASANINKQVIDNDDNENRVVRNSEQNASQRQMMRSAPDLSILDVNDVVALRVIFKARKLHADEPVETTRERERMLCYYIHHVLRSKWPETDINSVKDYVRYPKPNGYQSLHHTSKIMRNRQDFFFEVQVRSEEMHRLAEFGVAAHSAYKLAGSGSPTVLPSLKASPSPSSPSPVSSTVGGKLDSSVTIVSKTIANDGSELPIVGLTDSGSSGPYIHALEKARQRLMQSDVYVFLAGGSSSSLETGQLLTLTAGSRIIDVLESLRKVNEEFAFKNDEVRVWCNGDLAPLDENIKNGDTILIQPIHPLLPPSNEIVVNKTSPSSNKIVVSKTKKDVEREIPILRNKNSAQI